MPVQLHGSCHCGKVRFRVDSHTPVPYQLCACSICRKVGGYGGSVNLGAVFKSLEVYRGVEYVKVYNAVLDRDTEREGRVSSERCFCGECSSMLWLWDKQWPELCHPFASAIDSPELKTPETMVCVKGDSKPTWVRWPEGSKKVCEGYNGEVSIEVWHKENGEWVP
ncbi:Mss4-like protein [Peziza echinospora]|nr:Mss4-like protein [Peziza echinospora]